MPAGGLLLPQTAGLRAKVFQLGLSGFCICLAQFGPNGPLQLNGINLLFHEQPRRKGLSGEYEARVLLRFPKNPACLLQEFSGLLDHPLDFFIGDNGLNPIVALYSFIKRV